MKNKEIFQVGLVVGGAIALTALAYALLKYREDKEEATEPFKKRKTAKRTAPTVQKQIAPTPVAAPVEEIVEKKEEPAPSTIETDDQPLADEFPLRLGSNGERIERLKIWLMRNYGAFGAINQCFDEQTLDLVRKHLKVEQIDEKIYNKYKMGNHVTEQKIVR
ncbi:MAG: hypothetical protein JXQ90_18395 [Cyclobacteriaceae bacterium]